MVLISPRLHLFEINDQEWFPSYFREKVQACLTLIWKLTVPPFQTISPAELVAQTLQNELGDKISEYTFVDFCAGAGGPTPYIERTLNTRLQIHSEGSSFGEDTNGHSYELRRRKKEEVGVDFVLTDIAPHLDAWKEAAVQSNRLHYVAQPVDAANAPKDLLKSLPKERSRRKVFRLFFLAFHHFDDPLARKIIRNSLATSDGFAIFELQARTVSSLVTVSLIWPLLLLVSPFYYWRSPGQLFFTYIIPIIPFVLVFDGYISSLRTRTAGEILKMAERGSIARDWGFRSGNEVHTWPCGEMTWFMGTKNS